MVGRKKVLWLIKGLGAGGAEKLLSTALPYLNRQAFDYEVAYLLPEKDDLIGEFQQAGIPVFCAGGSRSYDPRLGLRLMRLLRERQVDLLHLHLPYTGILGRLSARVAGVKAVVYTEHNVNELYHPLTRFFNRLTYPLDAATIAVSDEVQRSALKWKLLRPGRVQTIPGGVDVPDILRRVRDVDPREVKASMGIPHDHLVVGNVAHIRPEKGQTYLLEAAARVLEKHPRTTFVIVGREKAEGALQALEARAAALGIQERVIFAGFQPEPLSLVKTFDVFVLSSLYEGLPIALLEAMALGVPPLATGVGGIPEVIEDGADGFVVPARDPEALAGKLATLLENPEMRQAMSARVAARVREQFSIQRMVQAVEEVYHQALRSSGHTLQIAAPPR